MEIANDPTIRFKVPQSRPSQFLVSVSHLQAMFGFTLVDVDSFQHHEVIQAVTVILNHIKEPNLNKRTFTSVNFVIVLAYIQWHA
jgi:hypothetical protein